MLSVNQLIAYSVITTLFKIKQSKEPLYLANRLGFINNSNTRGRSGHRQHDINIDFCLATSREGFMYQAGKCWNSRPQTRNQGEGIQNKITRMDQTQYSSHSLLII